MVFSPGGDDRMTGDAAGRLQTVAEVLNRLALLDLPPEAGRLLAEAQALCAANAKNSETGQAADIDPAVLDHVLGLVGPKDAQVLLERLQLDLIQCRDALSDGITGWDWGRLRMAAHNLVSLSGTAGADPLRKAALVLVAACDRQDPAVVGSELPRTLDSLARLLGYLREKATRLAGDGA